MAFSSAFDRWPVRLAAALAAVVLVFSAEMLQRDDVPPIAQAVVSKTSEEVSTLHTVARGEVPMPAGAAAAHASNLLPMPPQDAKAITLFWFSGERESGPLVQIAASQWDRVGAAWSAPRFVVNRHTMGSQLGYGLRRLGNPVAWRDGQGRMHLFVVATGLGGWAASRVLHLQQSSAGQALEELHFEPVRMLPLSWLWNTSYLVRNAPLPLADGGMVLPVYFELGVKYPVALRFGATGRFLGVVRISSLDHLLQPSLVAQTPSQWLAFMRDTRPDGKVGVALTQDAGAHWKDLPDLALPNPDSAVAGLAVDTGQLLLAHNPTSVGRARLDLSYSQDGRNWKLLQILEQGAPGDEFSYPALAWVDGSLWVSYTMDRQRLAWQRLAPVQKPPEAKP